MASSRATFTLDEELAHRARELGVSGGTPRRGSHAEGLLGSELRTRPLRGTGSSGLSAKGSLRASGRAVEPAWESVQAIIA